MHLASDAASDAVDWRLILTKRWDLTSPRSDPAKATRPELRNGALETRSAATPWHFRTYG